MNLTPEQQRELDQLGGMVDQAAYLRKYGSFSQRNPSLGKMINCPLCELRHRQTEQNCCNTTYLKTVKRTEPRFSHVRKNPRLKKNNPPDFLTHQLLTEMERNPNFVDFEGVSGIVMASIIRKRKAMAKRIRDQQKRGRKANRT